MYKAIFIPLGAIYKKQKGPLNKLLPFMWQIMYTETLDVYDTTALIDVALSTTNLTDIM